MAVVGRFEELKCWQSARALTAFVYKICEDGKLARDFDTKGQLKRAALSTMCNIAEGFGRRINKRDFIRFLSIAQSSSLEVKSITYALEDSEYLPIETIMHIRTKSEDTERLILGFIRYLRGRTSA